MTRQYWETSESSEASNAVTFSDNSEVIYCSRGGYNTAENELTVLN